MLAAALAYAARGWPVFPVDAWKKPLRPSLVKGQGGVHEATTNPETIREWWEAWPNANIACHVGAAGMLAIDLDPGHDLGEVNRAVEGLPATALRQRTPRGGEHLLYALAEGEQVSPSASKIAHKADVRSWGSYILLAPSHTLDGPGCVEGGYTWQHETAWPSQPMPKPAYRTDAMVRACGEKRQRTTALTERIIPEDLPESIAAAVAWIHSDACKPAIEGQGGDAMTYNTAAMMHSFGLSQATALDLMLRDYNETKCSPPWDGDQIETKVENAYRYHTSEFGNKSPAWLAARVKMLFRPIEAHLPAGHERSAGRFRIVDGAGIEHIADPEMLIPDLLTKGGYASISGPPGTFKTFVALDLCCSVATGSVEGRMWPKVTEAGPVLIALGEGRPGMRARVQAWRDRHNGGKVITDLHIADPVPLVSAGPAEWEAFCELGLSMSPEGYVLVVVDTATRAMSGLNPGAFEDASQLTAMVATFQRRLNAAVLVIFHTPHADASRAAGSYVFQGDPDTVLMLSRAGKEMVVDMSMSKQKDGVEWSEPRRLKLEVEGTSLVVVPAPPRPAPVRPQTPAAEIAVTNVLDNMVGMVLKANTLKAWTQIDLAQALACRDDVTISSRILDNKLKGLREDSASMSGKCYDAGTRRWRWRGPSAPTLGIDGKGTTP